MGKAEILIVEDESIVAIDIQRSLEHLGYTVSDIAFSSNDALEKAAETRPNLVLMDIKLRGKTDGVEAAEQIRARFDIPVVFLTAYADDETLQRVKLAKPFGYIIKPFDERELYSTVEIALYRHEMDKRLRESEERYRAVSELTSDFAYSVRVQADGTLVAEWITGAYTRITGYTPSEAIASGDWERPVLPDDLPTAFRHLQAVLAGQSDVSEYRIVTKSGETRWLRDYAQPVWDESQSHIVRIYAAAQDITERKQAEAERERLIAELQEALSKVKTLSGLLPICASCKKVRDDQGYWHQVEVYIRDHSEVTFSHGLCPDCARKLYPDFYQDDG